MMDDPKVGASAEPGLSGYVTLGELGSGRTGTVVLAREEASGDLVALKFLSAELSSATEFVSRFREEVAVLERLRHPNIVPVRQFLEGPPRSVVVMSVIDGVTLRQLLTEGPPVPEAALLVVRGSLRGLDRAHRSRLTHRDVKPENVLIDAAGTPRLVDFGVAYPVALSGLGLAGTPAYMAPEQWIGAPVTPATDVYATSMVLFECLTGRAPFADIEGKVALEVAHREAPVPLEAVPEALRPVVWKAAAKEPAERFADAGAFLAALEDAAVGGYGAAWATRGREALVAAVTGMAELFPLAGLPTAAPLTAAMVAADLDADVAAGGAQSAWLATLLGSRAALILAALAATIGITGGVLVSVHHDKPAEPPTANLTVGSPKGSSGSGPASSHSAGAGGGVGGDGQALVPVVAISPSGSATSDGAGAAGAAASTPGAAGAAAAGGSSGAALVVPAIGARATALQLGVPGTPVAGRPAPVSILVTAPGGAVPTNGTVSVSVDGTPVLTSLPVSNGEASGTITLPTSGSHVVVGDYSGSRAFLPTTNKVSVTAASAPATVGLTPSTSRATFGQQVTFDAQVKPAAGGRTPGGSVQFSDAGGPLGAPVALDGSGHAQMVATSLAGGVHQISARYLGDNTFGQSVSAPVSTTIDPLATVLRSATALQLSALAMRLSATLTGADGATLAGRTVTFTTAGGNQCTAMTGPSGAASCDVQLLGGGLGSLVSFTAAFAGDSNYAATTAKGGLL